MMPLWLHQREGIAFAEPRPATMIAGGLRGLPALEK
jgi:hypothetical protein